MLTNLFREGLEDEGFAVECARSGDAGLAIVAERRPDVVVLDPILPDCNVGELVRDLRACDGARPTPLIVLPSGRPSIGDTARLAGADVILARGTNPVADVIDAIQAELKMERTAALLRGLAFRAENWIDLSFDLAPEALKAMRRTLQEVSREVSDAQALADFAQCIHGFAEQMAVLGQRPLHHFTAQIEALALDLSNHPAMCNPSVLRTLGQAIDFLSTLLPGDVRTRLADPGAGQVLVVDDEDGARQIIMAAMQLANLKSMAVEHPANGLRVLGYQPFDLIFLDVGLPEMNGFDLCTKIRTLPMHEKTPIVFITGMATFQNRVQSSLAGGSDFVGKPFNLAELGLKALIWIFKGQLGQV